MGIATELNERCLGRGEREAELSQPFAEDLLNPEGIRAVLETQHNIITTLTPAARRFNGSGKAGLSVEFIRFCCILAGIG